MALALSGQRPGLLLMLYGVQGGPPRTKTYGVPNVSSAEDEVPFLPGTPSGCHHVLGTAGLC